MTAVDTVREAIAELEHQREVVTAQISVLDEGVRTLDRSYGNAVTPAARTVVALAHAILGRRS